MRLQALSAKQALSIAEAEAPINLWDGAIRAGKTIASIIAWLEFVAAGPPGALAMVGKTERTLKHNILDVIGEMLDPGEIEVTSGFGEALIFGRRIYLFGANDILAERKVRGLTLVGLYGDQIETWAEPFFRMALSRLSEPGARFFGTANPEGPRHYLKRDYIDRRSEPDMGIKRWHFRLDDNEALSEDYKARLRAANPGLWGKRYIDGEWVAAEGAIFDMLDEERHVVGGPHCPAHKLPHFVSYWVGIDYGTANPFVAVLGAEGADQRFYVLDELRWDSRKEHRQKVDSEYSKDVIEWIMGHELYRADLWGEIEDWLYERIGVDASATSFIAQLWKDGLPGVSKSPDISVADGLRAVATLLANDKLLFAPRFQETETWAELTEYIWDPRAQELGIDKPLKEDDHGPDALRYLVLTARRTWRSWIQWEPERDDEEAA